MKGFPKIYTSTLDSPCCCQLGPPEPQSIPVAYVCLSIFLNGVWLLDTGCASGSINSSTCQVGIVGAMSVVPCL